MKKFLLACAAVASLSGAANATTFSVDVTADPYRATPANNGLQTRAVVLASSGPQNFEGATYSFDLTTIGDSTSFDIYGLVAFDSPIDADDLVPQPSTATFDFGALGSITIQGVSQAIALGSLPTTAGYAIATFISDTIRVSATEGIRITLSDTIFGTDGNGNFVTGRAGVGFVNATFTLAAVPVPAALPLSLLALGALGVAARRRKPAKTEA